MNYRVRLMDLATRMSDFISPNTGDILVLANTPEGYTFWYNEEEIYMGWHTSGTTEDSVTAMFFSQPSRARDANLPDLLANLRAGMPPAPADANTPRLRHSLFRSLVRSIHNLQERR